MRAIAATKTRTPPIEATVAITMVRVRDEPEEPDATMAVESVEEEEALAAEVVSVGVREDSD